MRARRLLAGGLFVLACLALPAGAGASLGQLSYVGCQANDASQGCVDVPAAPLSGAFGVAVSPDGGSVYVASFTSNSISHLFASKPGGGLTFDGCLANDATQGCGDLPAAPLSAAVGVAASPDGNSVYVASDASNSISHFFVSKPGGQLTLDGCLANDATQGCGDLPAAPLTGAHGVAVSPNGGSVYVVSVGANSIAHFFRAPQGQLTYDGCLANDASQGCVDLPGIGPLTTPLQLAVSPDGRSVYVVTQGGLIVHFTAAAPGGQLTYEGCLDNDGSQGCVDLPGAPLDGEAVAVSPDGGSVYVASYHTASVAHFVVDKTAGGTLTYEGCLANDASQGCVDLPGAPLSGATGAAISPDGSSLYVSSYDSSSVAHFRVTKPSGQLTYDGCLADDASQGCVDLPAAPLGGAGLAAVSPDGGSVYVTGDNGNSIVHFSRDTGTGTGGGGGSGGGGAAPRFLSARMSRKVFAVDPKGAPEPLVRSSAKRGTTFTYSLSVAARVVFRIERPARGRKVGRSCRKPSRRNRHGHRCTRYLKLGAFAQQGVAGQNRKPWSGKLGKRGLRPGRYRATLVATSPGTTASKPKQLSFKVVRGR